MIGKALMQEKFCYKIWCCEYCRVMNTKSNTSKDHHMKCHYLNLRIHVMHYQNVDHGEIGITAVIGHSDIPAKVSRSCLKMVSLHSIWPLKTVIDIM